MESNILEILPTELIFRIFDFMSPREMSGFSCACQCALSLVNQKLDAPEGRQVFPFESYISCTGAFVGRATLERLLVKNGTTSCCWASGVLYDDENDPDL